MDVKELIGSDKLCLRNITEGPEIFDESAKSKFLDRFVHDIKNRPTREEQIDAMALYIKTYKNAIVDCERQLEWHKDILEKLKYYRYVYNLYVSKS